MTTCIGVDPSLTVCVCVPPHCSMTPDFESLEKELRLKKESQLASSYFIFWGFEIVRRLRYTRSIYVETRERRASSSSPQCACGASSRAPPLFPLPLFLQAFGSVGCRLLCLVNVLRRCSLWYRLCSLSCPVVQDNLVFFPDNSLFHPIISTMVSTSTSASSPNRHTKIPPFFSA